MSDDYIPDILDVVDEDDRVVGFADYDEIHARGLRHRSVNVLAFKDETLTELLLVQRSLTQKVSKGLFSVSVGGHLEKGEFYIDAARREFREELLANSQELPAGLDFIEIARYQNNSRPTNQENTVLYSVVCSGPFAFDAKEVERADWAKLDEVLIDVGAYPEKYTGTFIGALKRFVQRLARE
ncbi:MAG: Mut/nudix family protein isopentenyl-diphosphate isomerase [Candidatus Peregrinibacteria bacterium GW2011_GWC2_39_14]|nr:MAG: Mut/nudix family protein isopentenyl-diphosphate isomerase [Candidatus Peregrinibacteria bacterium GW2011_GWC2_39_14]